MGVLVGVDGSGPSDAALDWAAREAAARGVPLRLLHAVPWPLVDVPIDPRETEAWEAGRVLLAEAEAKVTGVEVTGELSTESAPAALIRQAAGADLVVVGNRGHGGFAGLLLGSSAQQVAGHAPSPVVLVRAGSARPATDEIIVGLGDGDGRVQLEAGFAEASLHGAPLRVLHAASGPTTREAPRQLLDALRHAHPGVEAVTQVVTAPARDALIEASARASLVVVGTHDEGGHRHLMALGAVTSALVHHAACPVLIARQDGR
ncbi:universal stress protein [Spirillospora sp. CA-294931]|uniref:universal stress protein n=1 Tax=Spirillospora sp. CA-294931 TaxID=3240042 RepID=UPI003D8DD709